MILVLLAILLALIYSWAFYNLPVLIAGIRSYRRELSEEKPVDHQKKLKEDLPTFSVIIPAKDEESVLPRLLHALFEQDYPREKVEIIVAEDGSRDSTVGVCTQCSCSYDREVKVVHGAESDGKPSALNRALQAAEGSIVAVFDADSIPEEETLLNAARYFQDESVAALQGRALTVNSEVNMLTKFIAYEEALIYEGYLRGKDALNLFVHLKGSCQFIRREVLEGIGGWSEGCLSEDLEMSARLTEQGQRIKYASDVRSWQECPESLGQMFRQRVRWFRGTMEVAFKYGRLIRSPNLRTFDAEVTLFGPFLLIASLLTYILSPLAVTNLNEPFNLAVTFLGWSALTTTFVAAALTLFCVARPRRIQDLLWLPFIYAYWSFQVFLATWAFIRILCRAPKRWGRTPKTGAVATGDLTLLSQVRFQGLHQSSESCEAAEDSLGMSEG